MIWRVCTTMWKVLRYVEENLNMLLWYPFELLARKTGWQNDKMLGNGLSIQSYGLKPLLTDQGDYLVYRQVSLIGDFRWHNEWPTVHLFNFKGTSSKSAGCSRNILILGWGSQSLWAEGGLWSTLNVINIKCFDIFVHYQ